MRWLLHIAMTFLAIERMKFIYSTFQLYRQKLTSSRWFFHLCNALSLHHSKLRSQLSSIDKSWVVSTTQISRKIHLNCHILQLAELNKRISHRIRSFIDGNLFLTSTWKDETQHLGFLHCFDGSLEYQFIMVLIDWGSWIWWLWFQLLLVVLVMRKEQMSWSTLSRTSLHYPQIWNCFSAM